MHEAALAAAALPPRPPLLRRALQPYSLGHELLLHRSDNPLVQLAPEAISNLPESEQHSALIEAVTVCSQTWQENQRHPRTFRERWQERRGWKAWLRHLRRVDWPAEIVAFLEYRAAGMLAFRADLPKGEHAGPVRFIGAPEVLGLYQFVTAHIPASEWNVAAAAPQASAWDFPYGLARMHKQAADERAGGLEIYNWREKVHDDFVAEMEAQRLAAEAAGKEATKTA